MKIGLTQIIVLLVILLGGGLLLFLISQRGNDVESKYREIVNVFDIAREIELDIEKFKNDIDSPELHNVIAEHKADAEERLGGQLSTPVVFFNGTIFTQGQTVQDLVDNLRASIQQDIDAGNKPLVEEFFDFNCIHCGNIEKPLNTLYDEFGDQFEMRKLYLPFLRPSSTTYAYAAEAANRQGKLREFSEILFQRIHGI